MRALTFYRLPSDEMRETFVLSVVMRTHNRTMVLFGQRRPFTSRHLICPIVSSHKDYGLPDPSLDTSSVTLMSVAAIIGM